MRLNPLANARSPRKWSHAPRHASNAVGRPSGYRRARPPIDTALLHRFEIYLQQHTLSPTTVRNYLADLRAFARWYAAQATHSAGLTAADFSVYRAHLCHAADHALRPATVNRRLQSLRLFGRFLHETGRVSENPTRGLALVRNGNGNDAAPRTLTPAETARLSDAIRAGRPSLMERDYAIMQLMLQAGLRVHEVAALRLGDLTPTHQRMRAQVRGQGRNGQRMVPLNAVAARALRDYLAARPAIPRVDHLFVSQRGQPLSMRSIQRVIDTYARAAGLKGVCAQSLRHTCAKTMLEHTHDAARVAQWLGHRSAKSLDRYTSRQVNR